MKEGKSPNMQSIRRQAEQRAVAEGGAGVLPAVVVPPSGGADRWKKALEVQPGEVVLKLALSQVVADAQNTRRVMEEAGLKKMMASIAAAGQLQPITVEPESGGAYKIIIGHRRTEALRRLGKATVDAIVRVMSSEERLAAQIEENLQREGLSMWEKVEAVKRMVTEAGSHERAAELLGKSKSWISEHYSMASLPPLTKEIAASGKLNDYGSITMLKRIEDVNSEAAEKVIAAGDFRRETIKAALRKVRPAAKIGPAPGDEERCVIAARLGVEDKQVTIRVVDGGFVATVKLSTEAAGKLVQA